jgi:hypothetical protein
MTKLMCGILLIKPMIFLPEGQLALEAGQVSQYLKCSIRITLNKLMYEILIPVSPSFVSVKGTVWPVWI